MQFIVELDPRLRGDDGEVCGILGFNYISCREVTFLDYLLKTTNWGLNKFMFGKRKYFAFANYDMIEYFDIYESK